jgi:hypothetical protein
LTEKSFESTFSRILSRSSQPWAFVNSGSAPTKLPENISKNTFVDVCFQGQWKVYRFERGVGGGGDFAKSRNALQ